MAVQVRGRKVLKKHYLLCTSITVVRDKSGDLKIVWRLAWRTNDSYKFFALTTDYTEHIQRVLSAYVELGIIDRDRFTSAIQTISPGESRVVAWKKPGIVLVHQMRSGLMPILPDVACRMCCDITFDRVSVSVS